MKYVYHEGYRLELPAGHPFPMGKYPLLKERLVSEGVLRGADILVPEPASRRDLEGAHQRVYLEKLESSGLSPAEVRRLGVPWSAALWLRSRLAAGGTLLAARAALDHGLAGNLAGGTHHAFADHGEGFCVLNDVAVAITALRGEGRIARAAVVDLDVHQGNGTAAIFAAEAAVFTFSVHGARNYPSLKMRSTLDVELPDATADGEYLAAVATHLPRVLDASVPDLVFYLAGVDVAAQDRYGRLALTDEGIRRRERLVIGHVRERNIPLVIVLAGGYAPTAERTAELHAHVFREALAYERG